MLIIFMYLCIYLSIRSLSFASLVPLSSSLFSTISCSRKMKYLLLIFLVHRYARRARDAFTQQEAQACHQLLSGGGGARNGWLWNTDREREGREREGQNGTDRMWRAERQTERQAGERERDHQFPTHEQNCALASFYIVFLHWECAVSWSDKCHCTTHTHSFLCEDLTNSFWNRILLFFQNIWSSLRYKNMPTHSSLRMHKAVPRSPVWVHCLTVCGLSSSRQEENINVWRWPSASFVCHRTQQAKYDCYAPSIYISAC